MFLTQTETYWEYLIAGTNVKLVYAFKTNRLLVVNTNIKKVIKSLDDVFFNSIHDFEFEGKLHLLNAMKLNFGVN